MAPPPLKQLQATLIVGGKWHDMDFARLELLKKLIEHPDVKTTVLADYEAVDVITRSDFIISYTCDVMPSSAATTALKTWLEKGGRWFALHATNAVIRFLDDGRVSAPNAAPEFAELLGTNFCAHPPIGPYTVEVADHEHALVKGIDSFTTTDEHYLLDRHAELHVLLDTFFEGETPRFQRTQWPADRHPVFYLRPHGDGSVLYLTLGHCRGPYDMAPVTNTLGAVARCSWELPQFHELLKRGLVWAKSRNA